MGKLKNELRKALFYGILKFNKKYKSNRVTWIAFDFFYYSFKFLLKIVFGKKIKDKIIERLGFEKIITIVNLPDGKVYSRIEDRGIIEEIYDMKTYDGIPIESNNPILDLGAHIGLFSLKFAKISEGKIYSFEPSKESFNILKRNIMTNSVKNVEVFNLAVSDKVGVLKLFLHKYSAANSLLAESNKFIKIKSTTLGDFIKRKKIKKIELIKVDIEGSEYGVLKSSINVLKKTSKVILELHEDILSKEQIKEIENIFEGLEFKKKMIIQEPKMIYYYK